MEVDSLSFGSEELQKVLYGSIKSLKKRGDCPTIACINAYFEVMT